VEGAKTPPKMLTHFHRAWAGSRKPINVLREHGSGETPQALKAPRRLPGPPAESEAPGTKINSLIKQSLYFKTGIGEYSPIFLHKLISILFLDKGM